MRCRVWKLQWWPSHPKSSKRRRQRAAEKRCQCSLASESGTRISISFRMCKRCTRLHQFCQLWGTMAMPQGRRSCYEVLQSFRSTGSLCCLYSPMNWINKKCLKNYKLIKITSLWKTKPMRSTAQPVGWWVYSSLSLSCQCAYHWNICQFKNQSVILGTHLLIVVEMVQCVVIGHDHGSFQFSAE